MNPGSAAPSWLEWRPRLRVLCLHGRCQSASIFEKKLDRLVTKAESFAEFVFVDGPVELPLQHGDRVNSRGWWQDGDCGPAATAAILDQLDRAWAELGPFHGVLGFSEGAAVALAYCRRARERAAQGEPNSPPEGAGAELTFAILAGAPEPRGVAKGAKMAPLALKSLHFASSADTVVPIANSKCCAAAFVDGQLVEHDGGHSFPQRVEDVRIVIALLEEQREQMLREGALRPWRQPGDFSSDISDDCRVPQDQLDELEALGAMLTPEELARPAPAWPVRLAVRILDGAATLHFSLPPSYPQAPCRCQLEAEGLFLRLHGHELLEAANAAREPVGFPCVMAMVQAAQQWAEEHRVQIEGGQGAESPGAQGAGGAEADTPADAWWLREEGEVDEALLVAAEMRAAELIPDGGSRAGGWARECGASSYGKPWEFIIGLVGKPSAGKSTFFNAATRPESSAHEAAMAAHPFTTIDPNVAAGWFAAPCPARRLGLSSSAQPEYGPAPEDRRRHPLLVKDVAGLVPGAYLGRGRGNAFLNDLCDADSLIHVVDASGRSDREGVDQGGAPGGKANDPLDEVHWVRREIHLWIFCNVRAKWDSVRRKARIATSHVAREAVADRLFGLFTGYHASRQLATQVYEAAGFSLAGIAEAVSSWSEAELHLLVACFLRVRFPIVVALNKVDLPEAHEHVVRARAALGSACVPVSARSEYWLWEQQRLGHLSYTEGSGDAALLPGAPDAIRERFEKLKAKVLEPFGSTGVLAALTAAVLRRQPVLVCPVVDFTTFQGLQRPTAAGAAAPLCTAVLLRPLSTVEEAFAALKHEQLLRGDMVRAEVLAPEGAAAPGSGQVKVLRREDLICRESNATEAVVLRILTNKKSR